MIFTEAISPFRNLVNSYQTFCQDESDVFAIVDIRILDSIFDLSFHNAVKDSTHFTVYAVRFLKESLKELSRNRENRIKVLDFLSKAQKDTRLQDESKIIALVQVLEQFVKKDNT